MLNIIFGCDVYIDIFMNLKKQCDILVSFLFSSCIIIIIVNNTSFFQNILGDDGILLYHNMTRTAPFHYALLINVADFSYWSIFNVLHVPATQVRK